VVEEVVRNHTKEHGMETNTVRRWASGLSYPQSLNHVWRKGTGNTTYQLINQAVRNWRAENKEHNSQDYALNKLLAEHLYLTLKMSSGSG
jgi:hypothetical protein